MRFLFTLLLARQSAPAEIVEVPKRLDADTLTAAASVAGENGSEADARPRGPLAHYHQIPAWFQADTGNDCTTSGCHAPLPHGQRIEVRAFLNMHATFLDCPVCHAQDAQGAPQARWFRLSDGQPTAQPALLRLAAGFDRWGKIAPEDVPAVNEELVKLLTEALADAGDNARLRRWLLQLETTNPQSKLWHSIVEDIRYGLSMHTHGEYNAKIGLYRGNRKLGGLTDEQKTAATRYLVNKDRLSSDQRQSLLNTIHKGTLASGTLCTPCHSPKPTLVDFKALGYPQHRLEALQGSEIVRQMLRIEQGQPFHLPRVLEAGDGG